MTPSPRAVSQYRRRGLTIREIAKRSNTTPDVVRGVIARHRLTRWDAPFVMTAEIAAEVGVTREAVIVRARLLGLPLIPFAGGSVLMLRPEHAQALRAYYAEIQAPDNYAHWLTPKEAARRLGLTYVGLQQAITRGTRWATALRRVKVRQKMRWAYRYDPLSVEEVRSMRRMAA